MEAIKDDYGIRQRPSHRRLVGRAHVHRHGLDAVGSFLRQLGQKHRKAVRTLAVTDPQQAAAIQVIDHDDVIVPFRPRDFIHVQHAHAGDVPWMQRRQRGLK